MYNCYINLINKIALKGEINLEGALSNLYGENKAEELTSEQIKGQLTLKRNRATHKRKITVFKFFKTNAWQWDP